MKTTQEFVVSQEIAAISRLFLERKIFYLLRLMEGCSASESRLLIHWLCILKLFQRRAYPLLFLCCMIIKMFLLPSFTPSFFSILSLILFCTLFWFSFPTGIAHVPLWTLASFTSGRNPVTALQQRPLNTLRWFIVDPAILFKPHWPRL